MGFTHGNRLTPPFTILINILIFKYILRTNDIHIKLSEKEINNFPMNFQLKRSSMLSPSDDLVTNRSFDLQRHEGN